ncbi:hypothetical protein [Enterococcus sp. DIV0660C]|uniref:hypothetical protein n=1 Tax=Enterococcus sp. DIV0660C TaxID=2230880 RepID=UPI001A8FEA2F|nr:hypothetical protein [Enterococcus sp. DIV0660C]MBO0432820.1 hypothetical protein [Enterococcus sp. DIV0660C]
MTIIDTDSIQKLMDSNLSAYSIEKDTGVSRMTITNYRKGSANILNMSLDKAIKLQEFWEEYIMEEYETLKTFIENDFAERDFGHGELEEFNPEKVMNGETVEMLSDDFGSKHSRVKVVISLDDIKLNDTLDVYTVNFMDKEVYVYYVDANKED